MITAKILFIIGGVILIGIVIWGCAIIGTILDDDPPYDRIRPARNAPGEAAKERRDE